MYGDGCRLSFREKFVRYLHPLQHDSTWKKTFHSKVFFEKWNDNEKTRAKKKSEKREWERTSGTTK